MLSIADIVRDLDVEISLAGNELSPTQDGSLKIQQCLERLDMGLLAQYFASPWFMRLWVVQESVLSRQATFFYGSSGVDMTLVLVLAKYLMTNKYTTYESRGQKIEHIAQMEYATELYDARLRRSRLQLTLVLSEHEVGSSLGNLLSSFHDRQNMDPRDKVFALLGLCWPSTAARITPDYGESLRDIYLHASSLAYTETGSNGSINLLRYARNMGHRPTSWYKENDWPTWLPCWQFAFDLIKNPSLIHSQRPAHEFVDVGQESLLSIDRSELSFSGAVIDTVTQVTSPMTRNKEKGDWRLQGHQSDDSEKEKVVVRVDDVEAAVRKCLAIAESARWLRGQRSLLSIIGEILVAGDNSYGYGDDFAFGEAHFHSVLQYTSCKSMSQELSSEAHAVVSDGRGDPLTFMTGFDVHTTYRVCFITSQGYLGLGSEYMLAGDLICVPQGSETPYILRKEDDCYILIGQCYISVSEVFSARARPY
jgi:hypothetical protein